MLNPEVVDCKFLHDRSSTPLSYARAHHLTDFVEFLVNHNANVRCGAIMM